MAVIGFIGKYGICQITSKNIKKWDFSKIKKDDSDIKNDVERIIKNDGVIFCLYKKKILVSLYLFELTVENDKQVLRLYKNITLDEANDCIDEFEEDMVVLLGDTVADSSSRIDKAFWQDKEIEPEHIKVGKLEISTSLIWILVGIIFWIIFDSFIFFVIYLCLSVSSGYAVKTTEKKRKLTKSKKKRANKKIDSKKEKKVN